MFAELLGLVGIQADPVQSREHILLSTILEHFWRLGEDLDLPKLIMAIQNPPVRQLGVFDVDTFYPQKDRFSLAMALNNIIAAPGFQSWLQGQPLDIPGFLSTPEGKPRHAIFYIAHLSDAERMFFATMLLNQLITWMRTQPGTTSLRALLYMDEIFGFFPPIANPPSKTPMLTLMKQARAFGIGVMLTTQNPADLDYKGLTNAGTWFIGRLQAERDKQRLLEGLESASLEAGQSLDRAALNKILSSLGKRVFLLHNVHDSAPVTFQTRWAMSYLRGPLTRLQVRELMTKHTPDAPSTAPIAATGLAPAASAPIEPRATATAVDTAGGYASAPPVLPAGVQQVYLPVRKTATAAEAELARQVSGPPAVERRQLIYVPALLGLGRLHFVKQTRDLNVNTAEAFALLAQPPEGVGGVRWEHAQPLEITVRDLADRAEPEALFDVLPETINEARELSALQRELADHLYRTGNLTLQYNPATKLHSRPDEDARAFHQRVEQAARELRDADVDKLKAQYAQQARRLEDRLRRAEATLERRQTQARQRKQDALITAGETVLSLFAGRQRSVATAARRITQTSTAQTDARAAEEEVSVVQADLKVLQEELHEKTQAIVQQWEAAVGQFEEIPIRPRRTDVEINLFAVVWVPEWQLAYKSGPVVQTTTLPAY